MGKRCILIKLILFTIILFLQYPALYAEPAHSIDSYFRFMPESDARDMPGEVGIIEADAEYSYEFKLFEKLPIKYSLGNRYIGIENSTAVELPSHLVGLTQDIEIAVPFFKFNNTYLRLGVSPSFFGDSYDFSTSDFRIPVRSFLIYKPNELWTFLAGVAVYPDFERQVWPVLGFIYKPNERLIFNIIPKRGNISYFLNEKVTLFVEGGASFNSEFEVTKDNLESAVLTLKERYLAFGARYKINKFIESSVSLGGIFNRTLKYRDSLGKVNIENGLFSEFRILIKI